MNTKNSATVFALLAAGLYAINIPLSKLLLSHAGSVMMAAFLYLGAGLGLILVTLIGSLTGRPAIREPLTKKELPYTVAMVVLDILAPILLMMGIARTNSANVSLLNNFEIVATSLLALFLFKEVISRRLTLAILLVTAASILLGFEGEGSFAMNRGSLFVLAACTCWGMENNCTKMISSKSAVEIVIIKGCCSGMGSLIIGLLLGEQIPALKWILCILLLGFVAYGLSICFYIKAQKKLGAAKTSAYYSAAPFLGVTFSMLLLGERPEMQFYAALLIMVIATVLMIRDNIRLQHTHEHCHTHSHAHSHGSITHVHVHTHCHSHLHVHDNNEENHDHPHRDLGDHDHLHPVPLSPFYRLD